jgi:AhpD family alkylhydroperoxidase
MRACPAPHIKRGEKQMNRTILALVVSCGMSLAFAVSGPAFADDAAVAAAKKDMAETIGPDAFELKALPDSLFASSWAQFKAMHIEGAMTIPPKYLSLIGLAVAAQIPCEYCIYVEKSNAKVFGATDQEIKDAVMIAAVTREWSTIMNGSQPDFVAFKAEVDAAAAHMREMMKDSKATQ